MAYIYIHTRPVGSTARQCARCKGCVVPFSLPPIQISEIKTVATVTPSAPLLIRNPTTLMKSTGTKMTIYGVGFDLNPVNNLVQLIPAGGTPAFTPTGEPSNSTFRCGLSYFSFAWSP